MTSLTIIKAISPSLIGLSFLIPMIYGYFRRSPFSAISLGWSLFAIAFIVQYFLAPLYLFNDLDEEMASKAAPKHTVIIPALLGGWILPLIGYYSGRGARRLRDRDQ